MTLAAREREAAIRAAVEAEREACARIAEMHSDENGFDSFISRVIALAISDRGKLQYCRRCGAAWRPADGERMDLCRECEGNAA